MKKKLSVLLLTVLIVCIFSQEAEEQKTMSFDKFGFKMKAPAGLKVKLQTDSTLSFETFEGFDLYIKYSPFDTTGEKYKDFSSFTETYREKFKETVKDDIYWDYYYMSYDLIFSVDKYKEINGKSFLYIVYDGVYYDEMYEDYDYDDCFEVEEYYVVSKGMLCLFIFNSGSDFFSDKQKEIINQMMSSIVF
ncbi:MAG: hypothetical protein AB7T10_09720 [bacterium]